MPSESRYGFRPMTKADLPRMANWLAQPHVARWWDDAETSLARIEAHLGPADSVEPFMILVDERPIGYVQSYDIHAEVDHPYRDQPAGTIGIDISIGEPDLVGRGHGPRIVDAFVRRLFDAGVPRVVIDPDPANTAAIRAYAKAGFAPVGERHSIYGPALLMARDRSNGQSAP